MLIVTCSTEAISFTESASTVDRDRVFTTTTEAVSFTEASAPINRTLHLNPASAEILTLVENAAVVEIYRATVAITLPLAGVIAGAEAGLLNYLTSVVTASESFTGLMDFEISETAIATDELRTFTTQSLTDVANASDSITATAGPQLHETATATNTFATVWTANLSTGKWKRAHEEFEYGLAEALTDVVNVVDTITPTRVTNLHESGYANEVLTASTNANNALSSTVNASDSQVIGLGEALADTANANDVLTDTASPQAALTDTATVTEVVTPIAGNYALLVGAAQASNVISYGSSVLTTALESVITAGDTIWAADLAAIAWVMNTETTGLSTYDNYEFSSMVEHDGVLYGVSPAGLFALTGNDDQGRKITANVKTGFLDFGFEETKRMSDLYVGYTGGSLECDVETYDGPQEVYTYQLEERDADAPRNNRMKIGKGLSSRYWRMNVKNTNGADFQLYNVEANIGRSNRRL